MKLKPLLTENKINAYIGAVLLDYSRNILLEKVKPIFSNVIAHHVTLSFNPSFEVFDQKYSGLVGMTKLIKIIGVAQDDKGQAVLVDKNSIDSENEFPHITISLAEGVKAVYFNELLNKGYEKINPFMLKTVIEKIDLKNKI